MKNKGQIFWGWITGLVLIFSLLLVYEFMSPTVETHIPYIANVTNANPYVYELNDNIVGGFKWGMLLMGVGYVFYTFIAPFIGNQEEVESEF